jgi:hypothetical protein
MILLSPNSAIVVLTYSSLNFLNVYPYSDSRGNIGVGKRANGINASNEILAVIMNNRV